MVFDPDILDNMGGLSFDEGHFHHLSEFAGARVGEGHGVADEGFGENHLS